MKKIGSGGAISFHIEPIFNGRQPLEGLKLGVVEPVLRQNWTFGPILWPSMKGISTEHDNLDNFKSRGQMWDQILTSMIQDNPVAFVINVGRIILWRPTSAKSEIHRKREKYLKYTKYSEKKIIRRPILLFVLGLEYKKWDHNAASPNGAHHVWRSWKHK